MNQSVCLGIVPRQVLPDFFKTKVELHIYSDTLKSSTCLEEIGSVWFFVCNNKCNWSIFDSFFEAELRLRVTVVRFPTAIAIGVISVWEYHLSLLRYWQHNRLSLNPVLAERTTSVRWVIESAKKDTSPEGKPILTTLFDKSHRNIQLSLKLINVLYSRQVMIRFSISFYWYVFLPDLQTMLTVKKKVSQ